MELNVSQLDIHISLVYKHQTDVPQINAADTT